MSNIITEEKIETTEESVLNTVKEGLTIPTEEEQQAIIETEKAEQDEQLEVVDPIICDKYAMELRSSLQVTKNGKITVDQRKVGKAMLDKYQFINNERFFYRYNDDLGIWEKTSKTELSAIITKDLDKHCDYWSESAIRGITSKVFLDTYGNIKGDTFDEVFNRNIYSIVFKNGTLDLKTGTFEHGWFHTYDYNTVRIPHNYNVEAGTPIKTINFLSMITSDPIELDFIFSWMGYLMVKGYPIQKMLFLNGDGGNGKSTLIKLMTAVVGNDNTSAVSISSLINNRFQSALLYNKLFNTVADINSDFFDDSSILKALTGDDTITIERKGENGFVYKNFAKMTYSCNRLPKFKDTSGGLERRILVLDLNQDFTTMVKGSDMHINDILNDTEEMEKVIAYSVANFMEVMQNSFNFKESESMLKAKSDWLNDDPILDFMKETFDFTGDKNNFITMAEFMKLYKSYCTDRGYKAISQKNVIEAIKVNGELVNNGIKVSRDGNKGTKYKVTGISLADEELRELLGL